MPDEAVVAVFLLAAGVMLTNEIMKGLVTVFMMDDLMLELAASGF